VASQCRGTAHGPTSTGEEQSTQRERPPTSCAMAMPGPAKTRCLVTACRRVATVPSSAQCTPIRTRSPCAHGRVGACTFAKAGGRHMRGGLPLQTGAAAVSREGPVPIGHCDGQDCVACVCWRHPKGGHVLQRRLHPHFMTYCPWQCTRHMSCSAACVLHQPQSRTHHSRGASSGVELPPEAWQLCAPMGPRCLQKLVLNFQAESNR